MQDFIKSIWHTQLAQFTKPEQETDELLRLKERHRTAILEKLGTDRQIFEKYEDCESEMDCIQLENAFAEGFSCAVKLLTEALR